MKVEEYNIKYGDEELIAAADSLEDDRIILKKKGDGQEVRGRIKYEGYEEWSSWGEALHPVILQNSAQTSNLISTQTEAELSLIIISQATRPPNPLKKSSYGPTDC